MRFLVKLLLLGVAGSKILENKDITVENTNNLKGGTRIAVIGDSVAKGDCGHGLLKTWPSYL
jgi:hypothetical protein